MKLPTKKCSRCYHTKSTRSFRKRTDSKDGFDYVCRACHRIENSKFSELPFLHPIMQAFLRNPVSSSSPTSPSTVNHGKGDCGVGGT